MNIYFWASANKLLLTISGFSHIKYATRGRRRMRSPTLQQHNNILHSLSSYTHFTSYNDGVIAWFKYTYTIHCKLPKFYVPHILRIIKNISEPTVRITSECITKFSKYYQYNRVTDKGPAGRPAVSISLLVWLICLVDVLSVQPVLIWCHLINFLLLAVASSR